MAPGEEDVPEHWLKIDALLQELRQLTVGVIPPIGARSRSAEEPSNPPPSPSRPAAGDPKLSPTLLASSVMAASIFARLPASGDKATAELMQLQIELEKRIKK